MSFKKKIELSLIFLKKNNFNENLLSLPKLVFFRNLNSKNKKSIFQKIIYELINLKIFNLENKFYNTNFDTIIVSHLTKDINENFIDEYMGLIDNKIKKDDCVIKIFINHTDKNFIDNDLQSYNNKYPFLILSKRFNIFFEFFLFFNFFFKYIKFKVNFFFREKNMINISLKDYLKGISYYRIHLKILKIIIKLNPKKLYIPFEGHPWEKLIFFKTKKMGIKRYGYQFNISDKNNYLFYYLKYKEISPDKLFITGEYLKNIAKKLNDEIEYEVIGSNRMYKVPKKRTIDNSILAIPERRDEEEIIFINFLNKYVDIYDNFQFYLKLHPLSPNKYKINKKINIHKDNVDRLISKCNYTLFRGSNLVFNMINNELIPLYLNFTKENISVLDKNFYKFSIDELKDLNDIKDLKKENLFEIRNKNLKEINRYFK